MIKLGYELFAVHQRMRFDSIGFHLVKWNDHPGNTRSLGASIVFEPYEENSFREPIPLFELGHDRAQSLIDQLWECGLRPTMGKQSEGVTAAQAGHLEDMRALAFTTLNVKRP